MKVIISLLKNLKHNKFAVSVVRKLIPLESRLSLYDHINKGPKIKLFFENNIAVIDYKNKDIQGLAPVFYFDTVPNFGDVVGPYLISKITGKPVLNIFNLQYPGIMAVGSILEAINRKDMVVWGTGLMNPLTDQNIKNIKEYDPEILSVRGRETARCLTEAGICVPDQSVYGDPALILPLFYKPSIDVPKKIGICPHYIHKEFFLEYVSVDNDFKIIDVQEDLETVVSSISSSSVCISTSLHGLIIAQAYGVPWVWLEITDNNLGGNDFKFKDFFSTLNHSQVSHVKTLMEEVQNINFESIAEKATLPDKLYDEKLILKVLENHLNI